MEPTQYSHLSSGSQPLRLDASDEDMDIFVYAIEQGMQEVSRGPDALRTVLRCFISDSSSPRVRSTEIKSATCVPLSTTRSTQEARLVSHYRRHRVAYSHR